MSITYSFDLGTNSIGWAVVNTDENKIMACGAKVFEAGVEDLGNGEKEISRNAKRREARGIRRQYFRKSLRKKKLTKLLRQYSMAPVNENELETWIRMNPYELRAKAISEKVTLFELGRIFYHMIQRRGFQSNSRSATAGDEKGAIFKGKADEGKIGISSTQEKLQKHSTLGSYLHSLYPADGEPFGGRKERIRNRYTTRQMYIDEFEMIWSLQQQYHPELTEVLKEEIGGRKKDKYEKDGVLFFQRPLRSQKHLIGNCTFEPDKPRIKESSLPFEKFRAWQFVNTIKCNGDWLNTDQRQIAFDLLMSKNKLTFKQLRKKLGLDDQYYQFNYEDSHKCPTSFTISTLSSNKYFGKKWWSLSEKEQEDIWHTLIFFDDKDKLQKHAREKWGFDEKQAISISNVHLKDKYSSLSRKAINNILPFLKIGFGYETAVVLGGIKNAFGQEWDRLAEAKKNLIIDNISDIIASGKSGGFINDLRDFLTNEFALSDKQLAKLYHHSANISSRDDLEKLPVNKDADREIAEIRNPVVITALFELRRLVNTLLDKYGKPDEIKVELARDLKNSRKERNNIKNRQNQEERLNNTVKDELDKLNRPHTHDNITKYKLWMECQRKCPYTGREISAEQLFSGEVQIEHIIPWSKSLDNSFTNKTLCYADENRAKGDRTPYEFYAGSEEKWSEVKNRALSLFKRTADFPNAYRKFERFVTQNYDPDFVSRQLNDTRYISREAKEYLSKICDKVMVSPGMVTSQLRHMWGLNNILSDGQKERNDHRHHAIDAIVLAVTKRRYVQELSNWNRYDRNHTLRGFPKPWERFWEDTNTAIDQILVVHSKNDKVITRRKVKTKKNGKYYVNDSIAARGELHKETVYGKRKDNLGIEKYHIRKSLSSLTKGAQIKKIADPAVREIIERRLNEMGVDTSTKSYTVPPNAFFEKEEDGTLKPLIYLPNRRGKRVPVYKVRMKEEINNAVPLKENINQHVNPRNNHHILIYEAKDGSLKSKAVSFWEAVERKKQHLNVVALPDDGSKIITTISRKDYFLLYLPDDFHSYDNTQLLNEYLYTVQKLSYVNAKFLIYFRKHTDARKDKEANADYVCLTSFGDGKTGWLTLNPKKINLLEDGTVDPKSLKDE
ncbi:MAG: type II CRISPR RNA-guided endonuclease Cas9 [Cyclobacteriaceae bacterium]